MSVTNDRSELISAVSNGKFQEAEKLLAKGVNVNAKLNGSSALHLVATGTSSVKAVHWLVEHGEAVDDTDGNGCTPLMIACNWGGKRGSQIAIQLIKAGCNVSIRRPTDGMSALEFAVGRCSADVVRSLIDRGLPVDGPRICDLTPAMLAARKGNIEALETLISKGCDLSIPCGLAWAKGLTCLQLAELEKRSNVVRYLQGMDQNNVKKPEGAGKPKLPESKQKRSPKGKQQKRSDSMKKVTTKKHKHRVKGS